MRMSNILDYDQPKTDDFKPFGQAMTKIAARTVDKAFEIYLSLYQAVTGTEEKQNVQRFSPDFFDLVIIDECHRGSAADDAAWHRVSTFFSSGPRRSVSPQHPRKPGTYPTFVFRRSGSPLAKARHRQ